MTHFPRADRSLPFATHGRWHVVVLLWVAAAATPFAPAGEVALQTQRVWSFDEDAITFSNRFDGARLNDCFQSGPGEFTVVIQPENAPVNDSPWYAFQVRAEHSRTIRIRLRYQDGTHRYRPKISSDGVHWRPLQAGPVFRHEDRNPAVFQLSVGPQPLWVAAGELLSNKQMDAWMDELAGQPYVRRRVLGYSLQGRPIHLLRISESPRPGYVFIVARQHPPEVSGAIGMMRFVETLAGDSKLAKRFRGEFCALVVPVANPDGVAHGHWRHNLAGEDMNRDWGPFRQPETRAIRDELLKFKSADKQLCLFLDFHSTYYDVFYTQPPGRHVRPVAFTKSWLSAIDRRFPDYEVRCESGNVTAATAKLWVHRTLGAPAITYEFGDATDRAQIRRLAEAAAEEMMRLMLAAWAEDPESSQQHSTAAE